MDFLDSEQVIVRVLLEKEEVAAEGLGGRVPSSMVWKRRLVSCWRQVHWSKVVMRWPARLVNGSGR